MGSGNIVNFMQVGGLQGSDVTMFSITTVPEGQSFEMLNKAYDEAIDNILLDRYVITAIELFDSAGAYQHSAVDISFCITEYDESVTVSVYRLKVGGTEWTEVTGLLKVHTNQYDILLAIKYH